MRTQKQLQDTVLALNEAGVSFKNICKMSDNLNQTTLVKLANTPVYQYSPNPRILRQLDEGLNKYRDLFNEILATPDEDRDKHSLILRNGEW